MAIKKNESTKYTSSTYRKLCDNKGNSKPLSNSPRRTQRQSKDCQRGSIRRGRDTGLGQVGLEMGSWDCPYSNGDSNSNANSRNSEMKLLMRLTSISILIVMSLFFYWSFWPFQPIIMETPIKVITKQVKAGETVLLDMQFDKKSNCTPEIKWYLVNGFVLRLSDSGVKRPLGQQNYIREVSIPETAPTHKVHLRIEYSCRVNPLRVISYSWDSEEFEVISK